MQRNDLPLYLPDLDYAIDRFPLTVSPSTPLTDVMALMSQVRSSCSLPDGNSLLDPDHPNQSRASCVLVTEAPAIEPDPHSDLRPRLIGVFTERDVVRLTASGTDFTDVQIWEVMTRSVIAITHTPEEASIYLPTGQRSSVQDIFTVLSMFRQHRIRHLPVLDTEGCLVGVITPERIRQTLRPVNLLQVRRVSDVMNRRVIHAPPTTSVLDLARLMAVHQVSCVVIVEDSRDISFLRPIGIVTERDIVQFQALELNLSQLQAQTVMSSPLFYLSPHDSLWTVHQEMLQRHVRRLVVAGPQGELLGIVTQTSLLQTLDPIEMYRAVELLRQTIDQRTTELDQINRQLQQEMQERQNSEVALREAEAKYHSIFEHASEGIFQTTLNGHYISANPALARIYGYASPEELITHLNDIQQQLYVSPRRRAEFIELVQANGAVSEFESQVYRRDGSVIWISENARAVEDAYGTAIYYEGTVEDITARKQAEVALKKANEELESRVSERTAELSEVIEQLQREILERKWAEQALRDSEERYRSVVSALHEGVILLDANGVIQTCNCSAASILGSSVNDLLGRSPLDLGWRAIYEDGSPFSAELHPALVSLSTGQPYFNITMGIHQPDGTLVWILINSEPLFHEAAIAPYAVVASFCDITKRKQVEEQLAQSKERYRIVSELTSDYTYAARLNPQTQGMELLTEWVTGAFKRISGFTPQELQQQGGWPTLVHPQDWLAGQQRLQNLLANQSDISEYRIITKQGEVRWLRDYACPVECELNSRTSIIYGAAQDITQQKQAEEALRKQTLRSQLFAEITFKIRQSLQLEEILQTTVTEVREFLQVERVLIYQISSDGNGTVVNEDVVDGWPRILGQNITDPCFRDTYLHLYQQGRVRAIADIKQSDVKPCHTEFLQQFGVKANLVVPILQRDNLWGLLIAHQCTSSRQWSELEVELMQELANQVGIALSQAQLLEALRRNKERFQNLIETTNDWVWEVDENYIYTYVSPKIRDILGYEPNEIIGKTPFDLMPPEEAQRVVKIFSPIAETQQRFTCLENTNIHKDGHWVVLETSGCPFFDAEGNFRGYRGIDRDVTERKQVEQEVRKALVKEKELSELKSRFVSMASHEFRTPLATILASSELLQFFSHKLSEEKKQERLSKIQVEVKNMTRLLDDVLLIGKAEAGRLEFNPTVLNLENFCGELIAEIQLTLNSQLHTLHLTCEGKSRPVVMDENLLRQMLTNLLTNAIKYSPEGGPVHLDLIFEAKQVVLQVRDQGIGIPVADQVHLFEAFHRAKNVGNIAGTGLGLTIIKNAVDLHGGKITVTSIVGVGTTFKVCIPSSA